MKKIEIGDILCYKTIKLLTFVTNVDELRYSSITNNRSPVVKHIIIYNKGSAKSVAIIYRTGLELITFKDMLQDSFNIMLYTPKFYLNNRPLNDKDL